MMKKCVFGIGRYAFSGSLSWSFNTEHTATFYNQTLPSYSTSAFHPQMFSEAICKHHSHHNMRKLLYPGGRGPTSDLIMRWRPPPHQQTCYRRSSLYRT